ncbi:MAG: hypothetical protein ACLTXT_04040 [Ruminococcus callidus]
MHQPVGGVDASVAIGNKCWSAKSISRCGGAKPIHLLSPEERKAPPKWSGLVLTSAQTMRNKQSRRTKGYAYFAPDLSAWAKTAFAAKRSTTVRLCNAASGTGCPL